MIVPAAILKSGTNAMGLQKSTVKALNSTRSNEVNLSLMVAIWPYQGFGNKFIAPCDISASSATYDTSDRSKTYQVLTIYDLINYSDGSSTWSQTIKTYKNYWVNGYGSSTLVTATTSGGSTTLGPFFTQLTDSGTVITDTQLSRITTGTVYPTGGTWTRTTTWTLSSLRNYADVVADTVTGLDSQNYPAWPPPSYQPPFILTTIDGTSSSYILWPDTATTLALSGRNINPNFNYGLGAAIYCLCAKGMMTSDSGGKPTGGVISLTNVWQLGLSTRAIYSVMSRFLTSTNKPNNFTSLTVPPFNLYYLPLDATTFVPGTVVNTGVTLNPANYAYTFSPSTVTKLGHTGNDIPSPGYGELGFSSSPY
jgi:hypothetical protein